MFSLVLERWRGVLACLMIAIPAWCLGLLLPVIGGPVFAILLGMMSALFWQSRVGFTTGITFTAKKILQYAVILLGFGLNLSNIMRVGAQSLPIIITTIVSSLVMAYLLFKLLKLSSKITILLGVGSAICGGSAIAATAPIIKASDEEIATAISVIFLFNVAAALIFPTLGGYLGLSNEGFGLFAGTAVNDVSSVTAAATAWDGIHQANTLDIATIVKLTRTLAIIPITILLSAYYAKQEQTVASQPFRLYKALPSFIALFIVASIITTIFDPPTILVTNLKNISKFFIVMAMSAIGLNTNVVRLIRSGGKPILVGASCWLVITVVSLLMQRFRGLW